MAGIFNLFNDGNDVIKGETTKSLTGLKTSFGTPGTIGKPTNLVKAKGLSIRSTSELNIPSTSRFSSTKSGSTSKQEKNLKPTITQLDATGRPISPRGKTFSIKKHNVEPIKLKEFCGHKKSPAVKSTKLQKPDKAVFKKPFTPKKSVYPGKENLASYYDFENSFEDLRTVSMESEFMHLLSTRNDVILYENSDPDELLCLEIPNVHGPSFYSDEEYEDIPLLDLPELSDIDDDL